MEDVPVEIGFGREISGFWRRVGALLADTVLLGVVCFILGSIFFDTFSRTRGFERAIGFAIALAYFGYLNSELGDGQTVGKRMFGIRVVDANGHLLSFTRSLARYVVFGLPFLLNGFPISAGAATSIVRGAQAVIVFVGIVSIFYLYIFNRRTRQSLHDIVIGSYVIRADRPLAQRPFPVFWRGHLLVAAALAVLALGAPLVLARWLWTSTFEGMLAPTEAVSSLPHVVTVNVARGWMSTTTGKSNYLATHVRLDAPMIEDAAFAKRIAQELVKVDTTDDEHETVMVTLAYGYDMGFASGWTRQVYSFKRDELP